MSYSIPDKEMLRSVWDAVKNRSIPLKPLTKAEYDALDETSKNTDTAYLVRTEDQLSLVYKGLDFSGKNGTTFTPFVSYEGVLSWTNDGGLENPEPVNIMGPDGAPSLMIINKMDYGALPSLNSTQYLSPYQFSSVPKKGQYFTAIMGLRNSDVAYFSTWIVSGNPNASGNIPCTPLKYVQISGSAGQNATINGVTTLEIVGGDGIDIQQENETLTISLAEGNENSGGEIYSTEETRIGTWIDGKPLYRKGFEFSATVTSSFSVFYSTPEIENVNNIIFYRGWFGFPGESLSFNIPVTQLKTKPFGIDGYWFGDTKKFNLFGSWESLADINGVLILEYTKTTD